MSGEGVRVRNSEGGEGREGVRVGSGAFLAITWLLQGALRLRSE